MSESDLKEVTSRLKSDDVDVRFATIESLRQDRRLEVLDILLELAVKERDYEVKYLAEEVFAELGSLPEFRDHLLQKLTDTNSIARIVLLAGVLQNHSDLQVVNTLIAIYEKNRKSHSLQESTAWALANFDLDRAKSYFNPEKTHIVVAEDEPDICDLICFTLRFAGWSVMSSRTGVGAYAFTRICEPDLVLLDVRMPKMTGYEACRLIKSDPHVQRIPVVFLSARGQETEIATGLEVGAEEYLLKPFAPDQLTVRIKAVMRKFRLGIYDDE